MKRADTITLPRRHYESLLQRIEDLEDAAEMRAIEARSDRDTYLPDEFVGRLLAGEHPLRVWREFRGLGMEALARKTGIGQSYLSEMETGKKAGSVAVLKRLAAALGVAVDDIIIEA